ncbi:hypothetical protein [Variovorax sp. Sphag1AA]|uniref:hypothetical protein n=1 Tax=Variovorax sp. Sphag1AA TaxID=2587027 RepID=UPI00161C9DF1|nr:hypothetical protein [Variovorax sp. Sphag1AA]MBB3175787.1 hypothetical protein [Variovorax sp. Sphag1AA]
MNKRSTGGFPKFGWQWVISLALLATVGLGSSIVEGLSETAHRSKAPVTRPAAAQAQSTEQTTYPVPAASDVFSGTPAPQSTDVIPSF